MNHLNFLVSPSPVLIWNALKLVPGRKGGRNTKSGSDEAKWAADLVLSPPRVAILATLFLYDYARNRWANFPFNGWRGVGTYLLHTTGGVKLESIPCTEKNFKARYGALETMAVSRDRSPLLHEWYRVM